MTRLQSGPRSLQRTVLLPVLAMLAGPAPVAAQASCLTIDTKEDESGVGPTRSCAELLSLGISCEDLACYARPVDLGVVAGRPLRCGVQNAFGYAGQCSLTCGQNAYDGVHGEGACDEELRTHPNRCIRDYAAGGSREGQCDFACGFCVADAAPAPLPPPPPPRSTCRTVDLMDETTAPGSCSAYVSDGRVSCTATGVGVNPCNLACQHNIIEHPLAYLPAANLEDLAGLFSPLFSALGVPNAAGFVRLMRPGLCRTLITAFASQTDQDLCAGYLNFVLPPIFGGQGACDFACNQCHSDSREWSTNKFVVCQSDARGSVIRATNVQQCQAGGGTYAVTTAANLDCTRGECCSHNPAGDAPQCPSWIAAFGEHACENVFAPDRLRAGQCDIACGFCDSTSGATASCSLEEFVRRSAEVTDACCVDNPCPAGGIPATCTHVCAQMLLPFQHECESLIGQAGLTTLVTSAAATCPVVHAGH